MEGSFRRRDVLYFLVTLVVLYEVVHLLTRPDNNNFSSYQQQVVMMAGRREKVWSAIHYQYQEDNVSSLSSSTISVSTPTNTQQQQQQHQPQQQKKEASGDWFQPQEWLNNPFTERCWHVEDICHSSHHWFYIPHYDDNDNNHQHHQRHQPPFTIDFSHRAWSSGQRPHNNITVPAPDHNMTIRGIPITSIIQNTCTHSPIPNHLVLHAFYNDMLGEFYSRTIPWLHLLQKSIITDITNTNTTTTSIKNHHQNSSNANSSFTTGGGSSNDAYYNSLLVSTTSSLFLEQTQMYLHISNFPQHGKMLNSHHVFTEAFRSNPLLSVTSLLDNARCRCLKRLILCGYYVDAVDEGKSLVRPSPNNNNDDGKTVSNATTTTTRKRKRTTAAKTRTTAVVLRGGGTIGPKEIRLTPFYSTAFRDARIQLRQQIIDTNPLIQDDIANFRTKAILQHHAHPSLLLTHHHLNESSNVWMVVGLTQRNVRRKWLNLPDIVDRCNNEWFVRDDNNNPAGGGVVVGVVCVEVNVEQDDVHPITQAIMHAACDMLIGIHGAQLTEGIWLPDGSTVIELLPWIPPGIKHGLWTQTTHRPTPLGEIFHETRLNHVGYPLGRDSASEPDCSNETTDKKMRSCKRKFRWDNRDYQVQPETVRDMITKFLPLHKNGGASDFASTVTPLSCKEWQRRAGDKQYVLYNVYCLDDDDDDNNNNYNASLVVVPSVHHYYWPAPVTT